MSGDRCWRLPGFPGGCRKLTLAGTAIAPKVSFLALPRTHTRGRERTTGHGIAVPDIYTDAGRVSDRPLGTVGRRARPVRRP